MNICRHIGSSLPVMGLLVGIGLLASPFPAMAEDPYSTLTLTLPRQPAADEAVVLRLSVGTLPRQARVIVRTIDGEIAGTIAPFGVRPGRKAGVHTIPVPATAIRGDKVRLRLEVLESGVQAARSPTSVEIEQAKLAFVSGSRKIANDHPAPRLGELPAWIRSHTPKDRRLRIAMIARCPDPSDARLGSGGGFRLVLPDTGRVDAHQADTELAAWLRQAWPNMELIVAPLDAAEAKQEIAALSRAMNWALDRKPDVMLVPHDLVGTRTAAQSPDVGAAVASCWRRSCLPLTIARADREPLPPGVLRVVVTGTRPDDLPVIEPEQLGQRRVTLRLSDDFLEDAPQSLAGPNAAEAYLALASAALPAVGALSHLERASRLGQTTPLRAGHGDDDACRLIDLNRGFAPEPTHNVLFAGHAFAWDARVRDLTEPINTKSRVIAPDEASRRILAGLRGDAPMRHLASINYIVGTELIFLMPKVEGIAVFRATSPDGDAARAAMLLDTLQSRVDERFPFYSIARDAVLSPKGWD